MDEPIIVHNISKKFPRYHPQRPTTLLETFVYGLSLLKPAEENWVLRDVSFSIPSGKMVGIIGANGAGKSTLLSLIGGVIKPNTGGIRTKGRIGALLFLGAGFHPDLTGRENVYISAVIAGLTRKEVDDRFDDIVAFSELDAFIESPLRTYSTGMQMRLAFAVAAHIEPDILLVDEVLAVGDLSFQRKCLERIAYFKNNGCTIVLVSHDLGVVEQLCDDVIWLKDSKIFLHGPANLVVAQYKEEVAAETRRRTPTKPRGIATNPALKVDENRFGSLEMEITGITLLDENDHPIEELPSGRSLSIQINYHSTQPIPSPIFSITISKADGFVCYDTSTEAAGVLTPLVDGTGSIVFSLDRVDLLEGNYFADVGVFERGWAYAYDYHWHVYPLRITSTGNHKGILYAPSRWALR